MVMPFIVGSTRELILVATARVPTFLFQTALLPHPIKHSYSLAQDRADITSEALRLTADSALRPANIGPLSVVTGGRFPWGRRRSRPHARPPSMELDGGPRLRRWLDAWRVRFIGLLAEDDRLVSHAALPAATRQLPRTTHTPTRSQVPKRTLESHCKVLKKAG
jgi:hypothetical protein